MSDSNLFQTTKNAPEKMPVSVIQDIKNLICPAPMKPVTANTRIVQINKEIQKQADAIALLEKHVVELEKRYQIQFSVGQVNMYNENAIDQTPILDISGNIPNVALNFAIPPGKSGLVGPPGKQGKSGNRGVSGNSGGKGPNGYWGNRG